MMLVSYIKFMLRMGGGVWHAFCILVVVLGCASCGEDKPVDPGSGLIDWQVVNIGYNLGAMWGSGQDVLAVSGNGVYKFDGNRITELDCPFLFEHAVLSNQIFGLPSGEIYVSSNYFLPPQANSEVYCLSQGNWKDMNLNADRYIYGVWGSSDSNLIVVGASGSVYKYDGKSWEKQEVETEVSLYAVFGHSESGFAIVGDSGLILVSEGEEWVRVNTDVTAPLISICGDGQGGYCAVGAAGTILKGSGKDWRVMSSGISSDLNQIRSSPDGTFFVAGDSGTLLRSNDNTWIPLTNEFHDINFGGIWAFDNDRVLAASRSGFLVEIEYAETTIHNLGAHMTASSLWGNSTVGLYIAGGLLYRLLDGRIRSVDFANDGDCYVECIGGIESSDLKLFIGGSYGDGFHPRVHGFVKHFDGMSWSPTLVLNYASCSDIWPVSESDVYASCGYFGLLHFNGKEWAWVDTLVSHKLSSVWGSSSDDICAVGDSGLVVQYNGIDWSIDYIQPGVNLTKVRGFGPSGIVAVGSAGTALMYDGTDWISHSTGTSQTLRDVWGTSLQNLYVVGDGGVILKGDGEKWELFECEYNEDLLSIHAFGSEQIYIGGQNGILLSSR